MAVLHKFLPLIFFIFIAIFLSLVLFGYASLHRSEGEESGVLTIAGLDAAVDIYRDEWGIPHIFSRTDRDLYFASGFAVAQDRLWQMDLFRRAAGGSLSEVFGEKALLLDEWTRTMGFLQIADQILPTLPAESRSYLEAYVAGINTCLQNKNNRPLEFALLQYDPQSWKPRECIAILRMFGWLLSMGWHIDPVMGQVATAVSPEKMQRLWPGLQLDHRPGLASNSIAHVLPVLQNMIGYVPNGIGSNAWVVAGYRSEKSSPMLANDIHLPFTMPALYYIMHLSAPGIHVLGAAFPGLPGVVLGRNEKIAWGVTNGMIDDFDFYPIKPDSVDPKRFLWNGQSLEYRIRDERIAVKGGKEKFLHIRSTPWGPLMPSADSLSSQPSLAMQWTGQTVSDEFTSFQKIMVATNWYEFREALKGCKTPGENFMYADRQGHIGYQLAASVPLRNFANAFLPVPDSLQNPRWLGEVAFQELPTLLDPIKGTIASANHRMATADFMPYVSNYWDPPYRYQRIVARLDSMKRVSATNMRELQSDDYNGHAAWFVPLVLSSLSGYSAQPNSPELYAKEMLQGWDFSQTSGSIAASVYEMTYLQMFRKTFTDELGESLLNQFLAMPRINVTMLDGLIARQDSAWFDDSRTAAVESCKDILAQSFFSAVDSLKKINGAEIGNWWWGTLHPVTGFHPFLLRPYIGRFFALRESSMGGGNFTINNGTFLYSDPFKTVVGPCVRQIVDLSTLDYNIVIFSGQSGHPFNRHYKDQNPLWRQGKLITLSLDPAKQNRSSWNLLRLLPAGR